LWFGDCRDGAQQGAICSRVTASRSSPTSGYSIAHGTPRGSARSTARQGAAESASGTATQLAGLALHALAMHIAHARGKQACAACSGHSPSQCQLPMSKVMPSDRPAAVGRGEEGLQRGKRAGRHGLVVLDHEFDAPSSRATFRPHSEPATPPEAADRHLQARAPSVRGGGDARLQRALSSQPPSAHRPSGLE
jgi:hypothetical protein